MHIPTDPATNLFIFIFIRRHETYVWITLHETVQLPRKLCHLYFCLLIGDQNGLEFLLIPFNNFEVVNLLTTPFICVSTFDHRCVHSGNNADSAGLILWNFFTYLLTN
jgi:hypothetical protein